MTAVIFEKKSLHFIHVVMPICEQFSELNTLSDLISLSFLFLIRKKDYLKIMASVQNSLTLCDKSLKH